MLYSAEVFVIWVNFCLKKKKGCSPLSDRPELYLLSLPHIFSFFHKSIINSMQLIHEHSCKIVYEYKCCDIPICLENNI